MAKKQAVDGRDDEIQALLHNEDIDTEKIAKQIAGEDVSDPPDKLAGGDKPPDKKPDDKGNPPPDKSKDVPDPETIRAGVLNEMFGDQYKTVEDVKKANIPASLQELATLRQKTKDLETQLQAKPKTQFVNEDIAKLNEFIRESGINDVGIFNRLNATDIANMTPIDALVLQHIIENPDLASKEPQVRKYFETKYNVDSKKVESGDLTQEELENNLIGATSEGKKAKVYLTELKKKIKMPEPSKGDEPEEKKKWTPEVETQQKTVWGRVNEEMVKTYANLPIRIRGFKEPIANFALPEEAKPKILQIALDYVVSNQLEPTEENIKSVATSVYRRIKDDFEEEIRHIIFERARSMTQEEFLKLVHNPSPKQGDTPDRSGELPDDVKLRKAFEAELER